MRDAGARPGIHATRPYDADVRTRHLLFDVMDTLVREPWFEDAPAFFGMTLEELHAAKHPTAWIAFEEGRLEEREFLDGFFRDGRSFDHAAFLAHMRAGYRWLPGMEDLLAELSAAGVPMDAFSNYPVWYRTIEEDLGLGRFLDWRFVSCRTGLRKPDARVYAYVIATLDVPPAACLFVDDREENIAAARAAGLDALRFTDAQELRGELARRGVLDRPA